MNKISDKSECDNKACMRIYKLMHTLSQMGSMHAIYTHLPVFSLSREDVEFTAAVKEEN